jgi:hypothetical protein
VRGWGNQGKIKKNRASSEVSSHPVGGSVTYSVLGFVEAQHSAPLVEGRLSSHIYCIDKSSTTRTEVCRIHTMGMSLDRSYTRSVLGIYRI